MGNLEMKKENSKIASFRVWEWGIEKGFKLELGEFLGDGKGLEVKNFSIDKDEKWVSENFDVNFYVCQLITKQKSKKNFNDWYVYFKMVPSPNLVNDKKTYHYKTAYNINDFPEIVFFEKDKFAPKVSKEEKEKASPKWMEEEITARCKQCDRLYIANKMLNKGWKIIFPDGKTRYGSHEFFYYCNETCLGVWKNVNPAREPKPEPQK